MTAENIFSLHSTGHDQMQLVQKNPGMEMNCFYRIKILNRTCVFIKMKTVNDTPSRPSLSSAAVIWCRRPHPEALAVYFGSLFSISHALFFIFPTTRDVCRRLPHLCSRYVSPPPLGRISSTLRPRRPLFPSPPPARRGLTGGLVGLLLHRRPRCEHRCHLAVLIPKTITAASYLVALIKQNAASY